MGAFTFLLLIILAAIIDGGLVVLLSGLVVGAVVYTMISRRINSLPTKIAGVQKTVLQHQIDLAAKESKVEPANLNKLRQDVKAKEDELDVVLKQQQWGNRQMAILAGVAAFMAPILGVVVIIAMLWSDGNTAMKKEKRTH